MALPRQAFDTRTAPLESRSFWPMGRIADELRKRFKTPEEALALLGMDAALLAGKKEDDMPKAQTNDLPILARGALMFAVRPMLAQDAKLPDLGPALKDVGVKNWDPKKIARAARTALASVKLAADADIEQVEGAMIEVLQKLNEAEQQGGMPGMEGASTVPGDQPPGGLTTQPNGAVPAMLPKKPEGTDAAPDGTAIMAYLKENYPDVAAAAEAALASTPSSGNPPPPAAGDEDPDEKKEEDKMGADQPPPFKGMPTPGGEKAEDNAAAMDAKIEAAISGERKKQRDIREVERIVRPVVGDINAVACDSADDAWRNAFKLRGIGVDGVHPSAYAILWQNLPLPSRSNGQPGRPGLASDAALPNGVPSFAEAFGLKPTQRI